MYVAVRFDLMDEQSFEEVHEIVYLVLLDDKIRMF